MERELDAIVVTLETIDPINDWILEKSDRIVPVGEKGNLRDLSSQTWGRVMSMVTSGQYYFESRKIDRERLRKGELDEVERQPDPSKALQNAERRVEESSGSQENKAKRLAEIGRTYLEAGDPLGAERVAQRALDLASGELTAVLVRGLARSQAGEQKGALADAETVLAVEPSNAGALQLKGFVLQALRGKIPSRLGLKKPEFDGDRAESAGAGGRRADFARDATAPSHAADYAPVSGALPPSRQLAFAADRKLRIGDYKGALIDLTRALQQFPEDPVLWRLRAQASNKLRNWEGALADAERALALAPDDVAALLARAEAQLGLGNFKLAFQDADRAAKLDPRNGYARFLRGLALEKLGDPSAAIQDLEEAMRLDPSLKPLCQEVLARLRPNPSAAPSGRGLPAMPWWRWLAGLLAALLIAWPVGRKVAGWTTRPPAPEPDFEPESAPAADAPPASAPEPANWAQKTLKTGVVVGKVYRIDGELGRGGMGIVYEAFDQALDRPVALKQLRRQDPSSNEELDRFLKEAKVVAQLRHPNLVEIYNVVEEQGEVFLVFDLIRGRSLDKVLLDMKRLGLAQAQKVVTEVCAALAHAHDRRVIHRDLKPANILLGDDGACRVMDFGIAHQSRSATGPTFTGAWGTPPYMAPEQIMGQVSKESDLYAVGALAYELLTGSVPFTGPDLLSLKTTGTFPAATKLASGLPEGINPFFQKALHPEPAKRFRTAAELARAFKAL